MDTNSRFSKQITLQSIKWLQSLFSLILVFMLVSAEPSQQGQSAVERTADNDCQYVSNSKPDDSTRIVHDGCHTLSSKNFLIKINGDGAACLSTCENTTTDDITRWMGIKAETDGDFAMTASNVTQASSPAAILLPEAVSDFTPSITTTSSMNDFHTPVGSPAEQSYIVEGSNLIDPIEIIPPTDFEISLTGGEAFSAQSPISLSPSPIDGTVGLTTIYVRFCRSTAGTTDGNIIHTSTGATPVDLPVSGEAYNVYTLTTTASPAAYGSISLLPTSGSYASSTVVTLTAVPNSGYAFIGWSGDLTGSTNPTTIFMDEKKSVTAHFVSYLCMAITLNAAEDTYLSGATGSNSLNYGGSTSLQVNKTTSTTNRRAALLKWDLSGIPMNAIVTSASITLNISDPTISENKLYNMRKTWVEGINDGAVGTGASYLYYDAGTIPWGSPGAANIATDRYDTNLWTAGTSTFSTIGSKTVDLNTEGIAVIQSWIESHFSNKGLIIQNYVGSSTDFLIFSASEGSESPKLNINYCAPSNEPTIITEGTLTAFSTTQGIASAAQTYNVSGNNLSADISLAAPAGFEISTDDTNYSPALVLPRSGGLVPTTTIYLRLTGVTEGSYDGAITHASTGATTQNVAITGIVSICSTVILDVSEDTFIQSNTPTYNFGNSTIVSAHAYEIEARHALMKWSLTNIPSGVTINNASLTLNVTAASTQQFYLYDMLRPWVEGDSDAAANPSSANWNTFDGFTSWDISGAMGTADRKNTNLWDAGETTFASTGSTIINLNGNGVSVLQGWVDFPSSNFGFTIQNYQPEIVIDPLEISSSEADIPAALTITYCGNTPPDPPVNIQPQDDIINVPLSAPLQVSVRDADVEDTTLEVSFYGRKVTRSIEDIKTIAAYDTDKWIADEFQAIGTVSASNGAAASVSWPGRELTTEYEWYATVSDGKAMTTSSTWSFTTTWDPSAVEISIFTAERQDDAIVIEWETANELDMTGFNIYRSMSNARGMQPLNSEFIQVRTPGSLEGNAYHFVDTSIEEGVTYNYWLEVVGTSGKNIFGPVSEGYHKVFIPTITK